MAASVMLSTLIVHQHSKVDRILSMYIQNFIEFGSSSDKMSVEYESIINVQNGLKIRTSVNKRNQKESFVLYLKNEIIAVSDNLLDLISPAIPYCVKPF